MTRPLTPDERHAAALAILGRDAERGIATSDGTFAWSKSQCLEILAALGSTKVAVVEGEFFRAEAIGLVPAYDGWNCDRGPGETATDYAKRSREIVARELDLPGREYLFVVLRLTDQRDAA